MASTWVGALLHKSRQQGKSPFPYQAAFMINNPVRRALLKPARIVDKLGLAGSEHVLELGPGPGFFSVEIARRLTDGRLELFDIQPEMLEMARRQLERAYPTSASPQDRQATGFHSRTTRLTSLSWPQ
jgi:methylase of polypeptide subunit release factors